MSWVSLDDAVGAVRHALADAHLEGAMNVCSPEPVTNRQFAKALGEALGRPAFLSVPKLMLRLSMGELADEALLASQRVQPTVLEGRGYRFAHRELVAALAAMLGKAPAGAGEGGGA